MTWRDDAACRGVGPEDFFPELSDSSDERERKNQRAVAYCHICPVRNECYVAGSGEHGTWGGQPREYRSD